MDNAQTGAALRPSILPLLPLQGYVSTREVAARIAAPIPDTFRELSKLEAEGVVSRRLGSGVAAVGWRALPAPAAEVSQ